MIHKSIFNKCISDNFAEYENYKWIVSFIDEAVPLVRVESYSLVLKFGSLKATNNKNGLQYIKTYDNHKLSINLKH